MHYSSTIITHYMYMHVWGIYKNITLCLKYYLCTCMCMYLYVDLYIYMYTHRT